MYISWCIKRIEGVEDPWRLVWVLLGFCGLPSWQELWDNAPSNATPSPAKISSHMVLGQAAWFEVTTINLGKLPGWSPPPMVTACYLTTSFHPCFCYFFHIGKTKASTSPACRGALRTSTSNAGDISPQPALPQWSMDSLNSNSPENLGQSVLSYGKAAFSLQPYRAPVQSGRSFQWADTGWREESIWRSVCQSPASKYFLWRCGEGERPGLLTVPCRESTRGIFTQMKFQGCDECGSDTAAVTRQYHLHCLLISALSYLTQPPASTQYCRKSALLSCFCSFFHNIVCLSVASSLFHLLLEELSVLVADAELLKTRPSSKASVALVVCEPFVSLFYLIGFFPDYLSHILRLS